MSAPRSNSAQAWFRLCVLSTRRTLPPTLLLMIGVATALLLWRVFLSSESDGDERFDLARLATAAIEETSGSSSGSSAAVHAAALRYFFASQRVWAFAAAVLAPFLVWRAAQQAAGPTRRADRLWLDVRPASSFFVACAQFVGSGLAALICVAVLAGAVLLARPISSATVDAPAGTASGPPSRLVGDENIAWSAPELEANNFPLRARLSLRLISGGNDPVLNLEFATRRFGASDWSTSLIRVGDGARLEVELPSGRKGADFELRRVAGGARALVRSKEVQLYRSIPTRLAILRIALRLLLGLSGAIALAYGLGNFVSAASATAAAVLPWALAVLAPNIHAFEFLPGGDLALALEEWTEGRSVSGLSLDAWMGFLALVALGLALATLGRKRAEA